MARNHIPIETVTVGDTISVTKQYRDTVQVLTGVVARILPEGKVRTIYTDEGVELGRFVIGKKTNHTVILERPASPPHSVLEVFTHEDKISA